MISFLFLQSVQAEKKALTYKEMKDKLRTIIIPEVKFTDAKFSDVLKTLENASKKGDGRKINFILAESEGRNLFKGPFLLHANQLSLEQTLHYICQIADVKYRVETYGVIVGDVDRFLKSEKKFYPVSGNLYNEVKKSAKGDFVDFFESKGIIFHPGTWLKFHASEMKIEVVNNPCNHDKISKLIDSKKEAEKKVSSDKNKLK